MKQKFIKKTVSVLLSVLLILTLTVGISAHEMYYVENGQPIPLKWNNTLSGKAYLRINGNGLNVQSNIYNYTDYITQYNVARTVWHNCSNLVTVENVTSNATVQVVIPTTNEWYRMVEVGQEYSVLGYTLPKTSDGMIIEDKYDALACSRKIISSVIYINPLSDVFNNDSYKLRSTIAHEIGHVLGLGHPDGPYNSMNVPSVMLKNPGTYYEPQAHDRSDITAKYG